MTITYSGPRQLGSGDRKKPFFGATILAVIVIAIGIPVMMVLELWKGKP
jgi:hypothetical protein